MKHQIDERAIFVRGPVVVFKWRNTEGWPVEYVSPNAAEVFGYAPSQFLDGEIAYGSLVHEEDIERVAREVADAAAGSESSFVHEPYRVRHADGSIRWLHDVTQLLRPEDSPEPSHFVGYVVDISARMTAVHERQALERKLLHTQKLESLGVLAGGVAHDFNNLLTGILGEASLAELRVRADQDELARSLATIQSLAQRAAELTGQLLAYTGRGQFVIQPVDLSVLVEDMLAMLETVISKKAHLVVDVGGVARMLADATQLQQIIMNLITNASDSLGGEPGTIGVSTRALEDNGEVELTVFDTGCGMSEDVRAQLFDPFFTTKHTGRGLGMSAVQGIVRGHNGRIEVKSEVGSGTRFVLRFPAYDGVVQERGLPASEHDAWVGSGTVLVVDDEPSIRTIAEKIFQHLGFTVLTAPDGQAGIELFEAHRAELSLVLLDLMMPKLDGLGAMRVIRQLEPDVPIILSTGYASFEGLSQIDQPDITAFIQKPYRFDELEGVVRQLLGNNE